MLAKPGSMGPLKLEKKQEGSKSRLCITSESLGISCSSSKSSKSHHSKSLKDARCVRLLAATLSAILSPWIVTQSTSFSLSSSPSTPDLAAVDNWITSMGVTGGGTTAGGGTAATLELLVERPELAPHRRGTRRSSRSPLMSTLPVLPYS